MKGVISKLICVALLSFITVLALGGSFWGWFLPKDLSKPVSIREGSARRTGIGAAGWYFLGRTHAGGGYRGGK